MHNQARVVVTNTTPLIALTAATGNLDVLCILYIIEEQIVRLLTSHHEEFL